MKWEEANQKVRKEHVRICREKRQQKQKICSVKLIFTLRVPIDRLWALY